MKYDRLSIGASTLSCVEDRDQCSGSVCNLSTTYFCWYYPTDTYAGYSEVWTHCTPIDGPFIIRHDKFGKMS